MAPRISTLLFAGLASSQAFASKWGVPPQGWEDFRFALVDDNTKTAVIQEALKANTRIYGRYRYLNGGVDTNSNWYGYSGPGGATLGNFEKSSRSLGVRSSFVVYMLQEEGLYPGFKKNVNNAAFMRNFFWNLEWAVKAMKGQGTVYVIEPDTWGYLLQEEHRRGVSDPADYGKIMAGETALVNNLGYAHLQDLPNTVAGLVQGIVRTIRVHAPDARLGMHAVTWGWNPATGGNVNGMVYWKQADIDAYADILAAFFGRLFGDTDKGDFLTVEKYGLDAGVGGARYYWSDEQTAKWLGWAGRMGRKLDLPLLGWQIPIGHMGLPNTLNRYEDTFMPFFFAHAREFMEAGFIGLWVGKGLDQGTDYANAAGQGDDGWLFRKMREFDAQRPYLTPVGVRAPFVRASRRGADLPGWRLSGGAVFVHSGADQPWAYTLLGRGLARETHSVKESTPWQSTP